MKEIFTDLYKKVAGFFQAQEKEEHTESKNVAINRMKLVLMQDRTNLTPFLLEKMRGEMIDVLAKYVEMDKEALELSFEQEGDQMALMLSIPVLRAKDEEEIQAILDAEAKAKAAETEANDFDEDEVCGCKCKEGEGCSCESCSAEEETEHVCTCGCEDGEECTCADRVCEDDESEDVFEENDEENVCSCQNEDKEEIPESPDEILEIDEEVSEKKSKKKN